MFSEVCMYKPYPGAMRAGVKGLYENTVSLYTEILFGVCKEILGSIGEFL